MAEERNKLDPKKITERSEKVILNQYELALLCLARPTHFNGSKARDLAHCEQDAKLSDCNSNPGYSIQTFLSPALLTQCIPSSFRALILPQDTPQPCCHW